MDFITTADEHRHVPTCDPVTRELHCASCGLVLDGSPIDPGSMYDLEGNPVPGRGPSQRKIKETFVSPSFSDARGAKIKDRSQVWRLARADRRATKSGKVLSLTEFDVAEAARRCGLTQIEATYAYDLWSKWKLIKTVQPGVYKADCVAAVIFLSARVHHHVVLKHQILDMTGADERRFWEAIRRIRDETKQPKLGREVPTPEFMVGLVGRTLDVPLDVREEAIKLLGKISGIGHRPGVVAGTGIRAVYVMSGREMPFSFDRLAETCGVTPSSIRELLKRLFKILGFQEPEKPKRDDIIRIE